MKSELIKFLLERTELIHYYKGGESDIVVAFKDSVLDEWSEVEHENFIFNLVKETSIASLQSEIDRLKIQASNYAYECDRAKRDRDKAESEVEKLKAEKYNLEIWVSAAQERITNEDLQYINKSIVTRIK